MGLCVCVCESVYEKGINIVSIMLQCISCNMFFSFKNSYYIDNAVVSLLEVICFCNGGLLLICLSILSKVM